MYQYYEIKENQQLAPKKKPKIFFFSSNVSDLFELRNFTTFSVSTEYRGMFSVSIADHNIGENFLFKINERNKTL